MTTPTEREEAAARIERIGRRSAIGLIPLALVALADLVSGALIDEPRIDAVILAACALSAYSAFSTRRLARRLRDQPAAERPTPATWLRVAASLLAALAFTAGAGYVVGGATGALVLTAGTLALSGLGVGLGIARGRRRRVER